MFFFSKYEIPPQKKTTKTHQQKKRQILDPQEALNFLDADPLWLFGIAVWGTQRR